MEFRDEGTEVLCGAENVEGHAVTSNVTWPSSVDVQSVLAVVTTGRTLYLYVTTQPISHLCFFFLGVGREQPLAVFPAMWRYLLSTLYVDVQFQFSMVP